MGSVRYSNQILGTVVLFAEKMKFVEQGWHSASTESLSSPTQRCTFNYRSNYFQQFINVEDLERVNCYLHTKASMVSFLRSKYWFISWQNLHDLRKVLNNAGRRISAIVLEICSEAFKRTQMPFVNPNQKQNLVWDLEDFFYQIKKNYIKTCLKKIGKKMLTKHTRNSSNTSHISLKKG